MSFDFYAKEAKNSHSPYSPFLFHYLFYRSLYLTHSALSQPQEVLKYPSGSYFISRGQQTCDAGIDMHDQGSWLLKLRKEMLMKLSLQLIRNMHLDRQSFLLNLT